MAIKTVTPAPAAPKMTVEEMQALINKMTAENEALKAKTNSFNGKLVAKVSGKGGISIYGGGKMPINVYGETLRKILTNADNLLMFLDWADQNGILGKKTDAKIELAEGEGLTPRSDGYEIESDFEKWQDTAKIYTPQKKMVKPINMAKK